MTIHTDQEHKKVLIAGDTHGNSQELEELFQDAQIEGATAIIQCGDFGYGWRFRDNLCTFSVLASKLSSKYNIDLYFLDGNHENFDALYELPISPETGLRPIMAGVTHLPRGSTLKLGNKTFRAFGGANSTDRENRVEGLSWWEQETITDDDVNKAIEAGVADVFLSHDCPDGIQPNAGLWRKREEWGAEIGAQSIANQRKVRIALDASNAPLALHGHLHHSYIDKLDNEAKTTVIGLDKDGGQYNYYILDVRD